MSTLHYLDNKLSLLHSLVDQFNIPGCGKGQKQDLLLTKMKEKAGWRERQKEREREKETESDRK